jgi:hypothetical protein
MHIGSRTQADDAGERIAAAPDVFSAMSRYFRLRPYLAELVAIRLAADCRQSARRIAANMRAQAAPTGEMRVASMLATDITVVLCWSVTVERFHIMPGRATFASRAKFAQAQAAGRFLILYAIDLAESSEAGCTELEYQCGRKSMQQVQRAVSTLLPATADRL